MTTLPREERMRRRESDKARRENQRQNGNPNACPECFGSVWLGSGYLPHAPGCSRAGERI